MVMRKIIDTIFEISTVSKVVSKKTVLYKDGSYNEVATIERTTRKHKIYVLECGHKIDVNNSNRGRTKRIDCYLCDAEQE